MRIYELRTYHLRTKVATEAFARIWGDHVHSLGKYGIEVHGVFTSPSKHNAVIALISYSGAIDQQKTANQFIAASEFRADMAGFNEGQIIRRDDLVLSPLPASPLQ
jgi:hypothetical protein